MDQSDQTRIDALSLLYNKTPTRMEGTILLHIRLSDLEARVWFGAVHKLAVHMLHDTTLTDRVIGGDFPAKCETIPWHSYLLVLLNAIQRNQHIRTITSNVAAPLEKPSGDNEVKSHSVRIAGQTILKPHGKLCVLLTIAASDINNVDPRVFWRTRKMPFVARSVIEDLPEQLLHILVANAF